MALEIISSDRTIDAWLKDAAPLQRLADGGGLYLLAARRDCSPAWRFDYSFECKRRSISLGTYPATGLALARNKATEARTKVAGGKDPSQARKDERAKHQAAIEAAKLVKAGKPAAGSFEEVATRWYETRENSWAETYRPKILGRLKMHVYPQIGKTMIEALQPPEVVAMCRLAQKTGGLETGIRVLKLCSMICDFAIAEGTLKHSNPCGGVRSALRTPIKTNYPAITDTHQLAPLLRAVQEYHGTFVVRSALQLAPMLMVRPGELRKATWHQFDLDHGMWKLPAKMLKGTLEEKLDQDSFHYVPLASQAVAILEDLFQYSGQTGFVFPGVGRKGRYMSDGTVNAALRAIGYPKDVITGHGFRATARTILVEILEFPAAVAEMQLAHVVKDANGTAYNRAEFLEQRMRMMQAWGDYLEGLRLGREVKQHPVLPKFTPVTNRLVAANQASEPPEASSKLAPIV
jgi:integrase